MDRDSIEEAQVDERGRPHRKGRVVRALFGRCETSARSDSRIRLLTLFTLLWKKGGNMSRAQRDKGVRIERQLVAQHHDVGIPCEKISRSGYTGPDLRVADEFLAEVKARKSGEGFRILENWLADADLLFLRRDRQRPMICMTWDTYVQLLKAHHGSL